MANGQIGEERRLGIAHRRREHPRGNRAVNIRFARHGKTLVRQETVHGAGEQPGELLHVRPALHGGAGGARLALEAKNG